MNEMTTAERAFRLARSGKVRTMSELRKALHSQGFAAAEQHTEGCSIQRQLKHAMKEAQEG